MIPKFRAWHKEHKKMYEIKGISYPLKMMNIFRKDLYIEDLKVSFADVVIMQSTGLFDKNGVEIFEGDILEYKYLYDKRMKTFGTVCWREDKACFGLNDIKGLSTEQIELYRVTAEKYLEIIGNIYENPELMRE